MNKTIEGKVVVITGGSSGIGEATARMLVNEGAKVVLGARREEKLQQLVKEFGETSVYATTDVRKFEEVEALVDLAVKTFRKVDVLFSNAGIMPASNMSELKTEEWNDMIDCSIKGVLNGLATVLPHLPSKNLGMY